MNFDVCSSNVLVFPPTSTPRDFCNDQGAHPQLFDFSFDTLSLDGFGFRVLEPFRSYDRYYSNAVHYSNPDALTMVQDMVDEITTTRSEVAAADLGFLVEVGGSKCPIIDGVEHESKVNIDRYGGSQNGTTACELRPIENCWGKFRGRACGVVARNVVPHTDDWRRTIALISGMADPNICGIMLEFQSLVDAIIQRNYLNFYHEHRNHLSLTSVIRELSKHDFFVTKVSWATHHGGSLSVVAHRDPRPGEWEDIEFRHPLGPNAEISIGDFLDVEREKLNPNEISHFIRDVPLSASRIGRNLADLMDDGEPLFIHGLTAKWLTLLDLIREFDPECYHCVRDITVIDDNPKLNNVSHHLLRYPVISPMRKPSPEGVTLHGDIFREEWLMARGGVLGYH
jgi:hypothetical protein